VNDWALRKFAGLSNLPAVPQVLSRRELAPYEGRYTAEAIDQDGKVVKEVYELRGAQGQLHVTGDAELGLVFYRKDYVLVLDGTGHPTGARANFLRDGHGRVTWLRLSGRPHRREP
jgi:hypothetical protein